MIAVCDEPKYSRKTVLAAFSCLIFSILAVLTVDVAAADTGGSRALVSLEEAPARLRGGFSFQPVSIKSALLSELLASGEARFSLPPFEHYDRLEGVITRIDSQTARSGDIVFAGDVFAPNSRDVVGQFTYANFEGSMPYLAVNTAHGSYEVLVEEVDGKTETVLKRHVSKIITGRIDFEPDEFPELFSKDKVAASSEQSSAMAVGSSGVQSLSSSCQVDISAGYTAAAWSRNQSIASSIGAWVSNLNAMIDDIGVSCDFVLVGTHRIDNHYEATSHPWGPFFTALTDLDNIMSNPLVNYRFNVADQADVFVMIQSADRNGGPGDELQGLASNGFPGPSGTECDTHYDSSGECGRYAVVRDDFAYSIRVFAHEVLHLVGAVHSNAYGGASNSSATTNFYGGTGFNTTVDYTDPSVTGSGIRSTTVMGNGTVNGPMCSSSSMLVNVGCEMRLPFIAESHTARQVSVYDWSSGAYTLYQKYFPDYHPEHESTPYTTSVTPYASYLQGSMSYMSTMN